MTVERSYIHAHMALRGIAAFLVVGYHLGFGDGFHFAIEQSTFLRRGYLWVDLFFILSGFIIAYTNDDPSKRASVRGIYDFLIRRVARIYPLHFVALAYLVVFTAATSLISHGSGDHWSMQSLGQLAMQIFLLSAVGIVPGVGWNIPSWSISAEMIAYMAFPLLALIIGARRSLGRVVIFSLAVGFYTVVGITSGVLDITQGAALLRALAGFSIGMVLHHERARFAALGDGMLSLLQIGALLWILFAMAIPSSDSIVIPAFIVIIGSTWMDRGMIATALARKPLQWLGEISYSVYLIHVPLLDTLDYVWSRVVARLGIGAELDRALFLGLAVGTILAVATCTYRYVEQPGRRWMMARFRA
jgi:peptidoglycan/LPS O-acetylase OafA/YrhL